MCILHNIFICTSVLVVSLNCTWNKQVTSSQIQFFSHLIIWQLQLSLLFNLHLLSGLVYRNPPFLSHSAFREQARKIPLTGTYLGLYFLLTE